MFYHQELLAKKGPLGRIWIAAHCDGKVNKQLIREIDISDSVLQISSPIAPFALRMSGHLLLGVVRIYSRKAKYLLADCSDALAKIKMAFRPGVIDLPPTENISSFASITLPETGEMLDLELEFIPISIQPDTRAAGMSPFLMSPGVITPRRENIDLDDVPEAIRSPHSMNLLDNDGMRPLDNDEWMEAEVPEIGRAEQSMESSRLSIIDHVVDITEDMEPPSPPRMRNESILERDIVETPAKPRPDDVIPPSPATETVELPTINADLSINVTDVRPKRQKKRKVQDEVIELSGSEIRAQLSNTSDIIRPSTAFSHADEGSKIQGVSELGLDAFLSRPYLTGCASGLTRILAPKIVSLNQKKQKPQPSISESRTPTGEQIDRNHTQPGSPAGVPEIGRRNDTSTIDELPDASRLDVTLPEDDVTSKERRSPNTTLPEHDDVRSAAHAQSEDDGGFPRAHSPINLPELEMEEDAMSIPVTATETGTGTTDERDRADRRESVLEEEDAAAARMIAGRDTGLKKTPPTAPDQSRPSPPALVPDEDEMRQELQQRQEEEEEEEEVTLTHDGWSRTTLKFLQHLQHKMAGAEEIEFQRLVRGTRQRKHVARSFFEILQLKTRGFVDVTQTEAYGPITVHKTERFAESVPE